MSPKIINIVCAADNNFSLSLAVTITSALANMDPDRFIHLFVIDGGITEINKKRLVNSWNSKKLALEWIKPDLSKIENQPVFGHVNRTTYFRILIPTLLPPSVQKCIYLDCDILVLNDLGKLWDIEMQGSPLLAVQDVNAPYMCSEVVLENFKECAPFLFASTPIPNYKSLGISPREKYFNSGILVMDLEEWRKEEISKSIFEYLEKNRENLIFWDQDGLNALLAGKWLELDHRWNQTAGIYKFPSWKASPFDEGLFNKIKSDPWIVHFSTATKPWHQGCDHPMVERFFDYIDHTDWAGWRPAIPSPDNFFNLYTKELTSGDQIGKQQVSVIMINWNGKKYIDQAIQSLLNQSIGDYEFIFVDNCSGDGSKEIFEQYTERIPGRMIPIYLEKQNLIKAFNEGYKASTGNIICFLDSNDVWFPNKLERVKGLLSPCENVSFHQHNLFMMDDEGIRWKKYMNTIGSGDFLAHTRKKRTISKFSPLSGLSFNRSALDRVFPISDQVTSFIGEYLTHTSMCFGEVLGTTECFGAYRTQDRSNGGEIPEIKPERNFQDILMPVLDQFYKDNNINLRFSPPRTVTISSSISENFLRVYQTLIPFKLRLYMWEKIPLYREIARSVETKSK